MFDPREYFKLSPADQAAQEDQYDGWFDRVETLVTEEFMCALVAEPSPYHETGKLMELLRGELYPNTLLRGKIQRKFQDLWGKRDRETQDMHDFREDLKVAHVSGYVREEYATDEETDANEMSDVSIVQDAKMGDAEEPQSPASAAVAPQASNKRAREDDDDGFENASKKLKTDTPPTPGSNRADELDDLVAAPDTTKLEIEDRGPKPVEVFPREPQQDTAVDSPSQAPIREESHLLTPGSENLDASVSEVLKEDFGLSTGAEADSRIPGNSVDGALEAAAEAGELTEAEFMAIWNELPASDAEGDQEDDEEGDKGSDESDEDEATPILPLPVREPTPKRAREEDPEEVAAKRQRLEQDAKWAALDARMADVEREEEARLARKADRKAQHETQLPLPSTKISKTAANTSVKRTVSKKTNEREDILLNTKPDDHITSDPIAEPQSSTSLLTTGDTHPVSDSGAAADKPTDSKPHKQRKPVTCSNCRQEGHNKNNARLCRAHENYKGKDKLPGVAQHEARQPLDTGRATSSEILQHRAGLRKGETMFERMGLNKPVNSGASAASPGKATSADTVPQPTLAAVTSDASIIVPANGLATTDFVPNLALHDDAPGPAVRMTGHQLHDAYLMLEAAASKAAEKAEAAAKRHAKEVKRVLKHNETTGTKQDVGEIPIVQILAAKSADLQEEAVSAAKLAKAALDKRDSEDPYYREKARKEAADVWAQMRQQSSKRLERQRRDREAKAASEVAEDKRKQEEAQAAAAEDARRAERAEQEKRAQRQRVVQESEKVGSIAIDDDDQPSLAPSHDARARPQSAPGFYVLLPNPATGKIEPARFDSEAHFDVWRAQQMAREQRLRAAQAQMRPRAPVMPSQPTTFQRMGNTNSLHRHTSQVFVTSSNTLEQPVAGPHMHHAITGNHEAGYAVPGYHGMSTYGFGAQAVPRPTGQHISNGIPFVPPMHGFAHSTQGVGSSTRGVAPSVHGYPQQNGYHQGYASQGATRNMQMPYQHSSQPSQGGEAYFGCAPGQMNG